MSKEIEKEFKSVNIAILTISDRRTMIQAIFWSIELLMQIMS